MRRIANGSLGLALIDFERSGYFEQMLAEPPEHLHTSRALDDAWEIACADDALHAQWAALEHCPDGSLGQGVWRFYRARGFTFPGRPESAPPNLAQHDWVHVLADYGSTVESEIEVFGLISRANDDPRAFSLLAMVLGLFETGYLYGAAKGFFEYDRGHLSRDVDRMAVRLADAMYRGAMLATHLNDTGRHDATDLLATDWFAHADRPLDEVRATSASRRAPTAPSPRARRRRGSPAASRRSSSSTDATSPRPRGASTTRSAPNRVSAPLVTSLADERNALHRHGMWVTITMRPRTAPPRGLLVSDRRRLRPGTTPPHSHGLVDPDRAFHAGAGRAEPGRTGGDRVVQVLVFTVSGSVALLADLIHNAGDGASLRSRSGSPSSR